MPYKLRHLQYVIEKVSKDPISARMLKLDGNNLIEILKIEPSPKLGLLIEALLAETLEDPKLNTKEKLTQRAKILNKLSDKELKEKVKIVEERKEEVDEKIKEKYWVK